MTLIWNSLLRQTGNKCTDLISDSSSADLHPQLSASQYFHWQEAPLTGEVMAGLPHAKCGYMGMVHPSRGSLEAPMEGWLFSLQYLEIFTVREEAKMRSWHVGALGAEQDSHAHYCLQGPESIHPEPSPSFISSL